jgi:hypothetical protein
MPFRGKAFDRRNPNFTLWHSASLAFLALALAFSGRVEAGELLPAKANATYVRGLVRVMDSGSAGYRVLRLGQSVKEGDVVVTLDDSKAELSFLSGEIVRIGERSRLKVRLLRQGEKRRINAIVDVVAGHIWLKLLRMSPGSEFRAESGQITTSVKGTVFRMDASEDGSTEIHVYEGGVVAGYGKAGEGKISAREMMSARKGAKPVVSVFDVQADEADGWVRWNKERDRLRVFITARDWRDGVRQDTRIAENSMIGTFLSQYYFKVISSAADGTPPPPESYDLAIRGDSFAKVERVKVTGSAYVSRATVASTAYWSDTGEVLAYVPPGRPSRAVGVTPEAVVPRSLAIAGETGASALMESIYAAWKDDGAGKGRISVLIEGVQGREAEIIAGVIRGMPGILSVKMLGISGYQARLVVNTRKSASNVADLVMGADFKSLEVAVTGLNRRRVELFAQDKK